MSLLFSSDPVEHRRARRKLGQRGSELVGQVQLGDLRKHGGVDVRPHLRAPHLGHPEEEEGSPGHTSHRLGCLRGRVEPRRPVWRPLLLRALVVRLDCVLRDHQVLPKTGQWISRLEWLQR